jgi:serine/threonine protein phosphatase 1
MNDLLALAPAIIHQVELKLADLLRRHGADGSKAQVRGLTYANLLYKANSSSLTAEFLQQTLPTLEKWCQIVTHLGL